MSLIFEREQLLREVAEEEANVKQLKAAADVLLATVKSSSSVPDAQAVCGALTWLAEHLGDVGETAADLVNRNRREQDSRLKRYKETLDSILDRSRPAPAYSVRNPRRAR